MLMMRIQLCLYHKMNNQLPGVFMEDSDEIRIATWADEPKIGALLCLAFATDPMVRWLLPDPYNFFKSNEKYAGLSSGPAFDNGSAYVIGNMFGAALWLPPGVEVDSGPVAGFEFTALNNQ